MIIVTGGAGFIGSNFVHHLLSRYPDYHVAVLDKLTYAGNPDNLHFEREGLDPARHELRHGDIRDPEAAAAAMAGADYVVNFAAETHVDRSLLDASAFVRTDVEGTSCCSRRRGRAVSAASSTSRPQRCTGRPARPRWMKTRRSCR